MNQFQMLHQLQTMHLLRLMVNTDESRAALARTEKCCFALPPTTWGAAGGDDDRHADDQHEEDTISTCVNSTNEARRILWTNEHISCHSINHRISTTKSNFFLSRTSPSPSSSFLPSPPPPTKEKRRRAIMKSPNNKMSKRKIRRISDTRNVEAPKCRSLLPNVGINDTSSTSIDIVSIEDALLTMDNYD